jgi:hypothetical protein
MSFEHSNTDASRKRQKTYHLNPNAEPFRPRADDDAEPFRPRADDDAELDVSIQNLWIEFELN